MGRRHRINCARRGRTGCSGRGLSYGRPQTESNRSASARAAQQRCRYAQQGDGPRYAAVALCSPTPQLTGVASARMHAHLGQVTAQRPAAVLDQRCFRRVGGRCCRDDLVQDRLRNARIFPPMTAVPGWVFGPLNKEQADSALYTHHSYSHNHVAHAPMFAVARLMTETRNAHLKYKSRAPVGSWSPQVYWCSAAQRTARTSFDSARTGSRASLCCRWCTRASRPSTRRGPHCAWRADSGAGVAGPGHRPVHDQQPQLHRDAQR